MNSLVRNPVIITNPWLSSAPKVNKQIIKKKITTREVRSVHKLSKTTQTRMYVEQLLPLYPNVTKAKIQAALILADNNVHEACLILDNKFNVKKYIVMAKWSGELYQKPATSTENVYKILNDGPQNSTVVTDTQESALNFSILKTDSQCSNVYDSKDPSTSSTDIEDKQWFGESCKTFEEKVGVVITKNSGGYKVSPL